MALGNGSRGQPRQQIRLERVEGAGARRTRVSAAGRSIVQGGFGSGPRNAGSAGSAGTTRRSGKPAPREHKSYGAPSIRQQNKNGYKSIADIGSSKFKTLFSREYLAGSLPFRIDHGCNQNKLAWDVPISQAQYNPLLSTCFEGITETEHPYVFLSRAAVTELLAAEGAAEKVLPMLPTLITPIRAALMQNKKDLGIVEFCLRTLETLSELTGQHMNTYLRNLVPQIHKISFSKQFDQHVTSVFQTFEQNGGKVALNEIKRRVPTYTTINM